MDDQAFKIIELIITALIGGGAVAIGRFLLNYLKEKNALDLQRDSANLDRVDRQGKIDRLNADYIITHFEKILSDKDREHRDDHDQWQRDKINILSELRRTRDAYQINLATLEGMRIRLADRDRQVSELRGGVHPLLATPDRTDSVIITDDQGDYLLHKSECNSPHKMVRRRYYGEEYMCIIPGRHVSRGPVGTGLVAAGNGPG
jgi:hypothetical protein